MKNPPLGTAPPPNPTQTSTGAYPWPPSREAELQRLVPLWPKDLADISLAGRRRVVRLLEKALRGERRRGRAGHWTYDLARHAALVRVLKIERRVFDDIARRSSAKENGPPKGEPL